MRIGLSYCCIPRVRHGMDFDGKVLRGHAKFSERDLQGMSQNMRNTNEWATRGREGVYHDMLNDDWEARTYKSYKRSTAGQYRTTVPPKPVTHY